MIVLSSLVRVGRWLFAILITLTCINIQSAALHQAPDYAGAFIDDKLETFIALPCAEKWRQEHARETTLLRLATVGEGWERGYLPDAECQKTGAFRGREWLMPAVLLQWIGLISPLTNWWDVPYDTPNGVVYPHGYTSERELMKNTPDILTFDRQALSPAIGKAVSEIKSLPGAYCNDSGCLFNEPVPLDLCPPMAECKKLYLSFQSGVVVGFLVNLSSNSWNKSLDGTSVALGANKERGVSNENRTVSYKTVWYANGRQLSYHRDITTKDDGSKDEIFSVMSAILK